MKVAQGNKFNDNLLFHAVREIRQAAAILENGIKPIEEKGYFEKISLSDTSMINDPEANWNEACSFTKFTGLQMLSFVIDKNRLEKPPMKRIDFDGNDMWKDEVIVDSVNLDAIVGVVIREENANRKLSDFLIEGTFDRETMVKMGADKNEKLLNAIKDRIVDQTFSRIREVNPEFDKNGELKERYIKSIIEAGHEKENKEISQIIQKEVASQVSGGKDPTLLEYLSEKMPKEWSLSYLPKHFYAENYKIGEYISKYRKGDAQYKKNNLGDDRK